jgi:hypothetical protein
MAKKFYDFRHYIQFIIHQNNRTRKIPFPTLTKEEPSPFSPLALSLSLTEDNRIQLHRIFCVDLYMPSNRWLRNGARAQERDKRDILNIFPFLFCTEDSYSLHYLQFNYLKH